MRGLTVIGGLIAVTQAGPVARAAWQASQADAVVYYLRTGQIAKVDERSVRAGIDALDRAVAIDPVSTRYLNRSELLAGAGLTPKVLAEAQLRDDWVRRARADLVTGLAGAPAHGVDWLRLATVQLQLEGASRPVIAMMFTSIDMAGRQSQAWPALLRVILDCWPVLTDSQKERLRSHVEMMWRQSRGDRRLFGYAAYSEADYLILAWFLRDVPGALQEFATIVEKVRKE